MPNPQQRIKPLLYYFCLKPKAFIISCTDVLICRPDLKTKKEAWHIFLKVLSQYILLSELPLKDWLILKILFPFHCCTSNIHPNIHIRNEVEKIEMNYFYEIKSLKTGKGISEGIRRPKRTKYYFERNPNRPKASRTVWSKSLLSVKTIKSVQTL